MPQQARAALIRWLKKQEEARPRKVGKELVSDEEPAFVATNGAATQVILQGRRKNVCLVFEREAQRISLPPGRYRVRTMRVTRIANGTPWFLSATAGPHSKPVSLEAGVTKRLDFEPTVYFKAHARRHGKELQLGFAIQDSARRGMSVYENWKRIRVKYKLLAADGSVLARGTTRYG